MEDTLRAIITQDIILQIVVLILVVMEDTLRVRSMNNLVNTFLS